MFKKSLHCRWVFLAGLTLLAPHLAGAQTQSAPPLTAAHLEPSSDDFGEFGPPTGFGASVGISGTTAAVGVPLYVLLDASGSHPLELGRVALFTQGSDGAWMRTASVIPADRQPDEEEFGGSLALAHNILIVGSSAAVRIFVNEGGAWKQTATLPQAIAPVAFNGTTFPSLAFDGRYFAFVANPPTSSGGGASAFLLYVYSVDASGKPELVSTLSPANLSPGGIALANGILAVKGLDSGGDGLVYVYSQHSATPAVPQILRSGEPTPDSTFGNSIAIWNRTILIGAPGAYGQPNDNTGGYFSGAAFVFAPGPEGWRQTQQIIPNDSAGFGTAVVLSHDGALISAPYTDDNFATILGHTDVYLWRGNQLVIAKDIPPTGTSTALSDTGAAAIIGTNQEIIQYAFYEYADIVTLAPKGSTSP